MEKTAFLTRKKADTAEGNCFQLIHFSYAVTNDLPAMDVGVCPCVKRNFEYDDAETNVKRYSEGRLGGFEATFLSSYLASSAVLGVESRKKRSEKDTTTIVSRTRARATLCTCKYLPERTARPCGANGADRGETRRCRRIEGEDGRERVDQEA
ncbi:hypothetical protein ALC60_06893 [Trachymyrmex zeteki]|uniref:Uncharacterized protein n=1 Tax=Mycetomoellerius zeteki TaxID=64791 RepID=A0A151X267_9HYME|nr:hypothetical protein ALC60_06893 [Trachymyrmex zeteki]